MTKDNPFKYFRTGREIISLAVVVYVRFPLALRRHLCSRQNFRLNRAAALGEWCGLCADQGAGQLFDLRPVRRRLTPPGDDITIPAKETLKRHGQPDVVIPDCQRSVGAVMIWIKAATEVKMEQ